MIDPLGPDPADPAVAAKKTGEVVSDFDLPGSTAPSRPKIRYANYDSPEALVRLEQQPAAASTPEPRKTDPPVKVPKTMPATKQKPLTESASTALAHPIPPKPGKLGRAIGIARTVLPIVGNLLPLLEGSVVGVASNLIANRQGKEVDLKPLEDAIAGLQSDQRALAFHTSQQKSALGRIEDEFGALQEVVQKQAADQAELAEQVMKLAKRLSGFMRMVTILLIVLILFTAVLVFRIAYIMRF
jgi:hypothetical protein